MSEPTKNLSQKILTEREERIEQFREELGVTRAHAASIVDQETAQKNRQEADQEAKGK